MTPEVEAFRAQAGVVAACAFFACGVFVVATLKFWARTLRARKDPDSDLFFVESSACVMFFVLALAAFMIGTWKLGESVGAEHAMKAETRPVVQGR